MFLSEIANCFESIVAGKREKVMASRNTTELLIELSNGDVTVFDELLPIIYSELRRVAANYLRRERRVHKPQPTIPLTSNEITLGYDLV